MPVDWNAVGGSVTPPRAGVDWDAVSKHATSRPGVDWHAVASAAGGVASRLGVPRVIDLLDRPRQTVQAALAEKPGDPVAQLRAAANTFMHGGADEHTRDRARANVDATLHTNLAGEHRAAKPGLEQGAGDFAFDTFTDPMTFAGGPMLKALGIALRGGVRGAGAVAAKAAPGLAAEGSEYARAVGDFFTHGGSAKRTLGDDRYNNAILADNRQQAREEMARHLLTKRHSAAVDGLNDAERLDAYRIVAGQSDGRGASPTVRAAADQLKALRNDMGALYADETGRRKLAYGGGRLMPSQRAASVNGVPRALAAVEDDGLGGALNALRDAADTRVGRRASGPRRLVARADREYDLPPELRDFAAPTDQGLLSAGSIRRDYLPAPHTGEDLIADDVRPRAYNLLNPTAYNARERDALGELTLADVPKLDDAFRGAIAQAARQGTAGRLRDEVGIRLGSAENNPALLDLFERTPKARGNARTTGEKVADRWQSIVDIPKATVTAFGLKHGLINVPALAALSEGPGAAMSAFVRGARASASSPEKRYAQLRPAIEAGVISPFEDRRSPFIEALAAGAQKIPGPLGDLLGNGVREVSDAASNVTWAIDDAAKAAVLRRKLARLGPNATQAERNAAAAETLREIVDYGHRSHATERLSNIAPFATFRSKLPVAVGSSLARHPERALAADRATNGFASTGETETGGAHYDESNPLSDALQLVGQPQRYARATLADPLKALLSSTADAGVASGALHPEDRRNAAQIDLLRYFTYGHPLLPNVDDRTGRHRAGFITQQLAGALPFGLGEAALNAAGVSDFPTRTQREWLQQLLLGPTLGVHQR